MDSPVIRWLGLAALCFAELLVFVDNTIVNVALPKIATDLGAGTSGLQMVVDVYTLVFAGLLLTGGYVGDRFGRKTILIIGIVGFAALSALAATSNNLGQLIAARAGLGLFAALVFPATLAIVVIMFDDLRERAIAVACWAETGIRTLPFAIAMAVFTGPSMWLGSKIGAGRVAAIGSLVMAVAFWLTIRYDMYTSYWGVIVPVMVTLALGVALVSGPATFAVLNELSPGQVGAGSAVNDTSRELGGTLGVAVLGSVLASVYSGKMADGLGAIQLPEEARGAAANSMLSGVHAARSIPGPSGIQLIDLVKAAFLDGFHMASIVAGGVAAIAATAGWLLLATRSRMTDNGDADHRSGSGSNRTETSQSEPDAPSRR
ncbi:MFS transporter [Nocardia sp. NPDC047654]|uniref:MFS transporter n=1 Tax=Nocardia sp. NPDC047654 TaxID=3364314 RepID=UPI003719CA63